MPVSNSQPRRVSLVPILEAIEARLVAYEVASASCITHFAKQGPAPDHQADQVLRLKPRGFALSRPEDEAAGRVDTRLVRHLDVILRVRLGLDEPDRDTEWLLNAAGYFVLEEAVMDALHDFWPGADAGDALTGYPMKMIAGTDPETDPKKKGWGGAALTFEYVYQPPLDQTDQ